MNCIEDNSNILVNELYSKIEERYKIPYIGIIDKLNQIMLWQIENYGYDPDKESYENIKKLMQELNPKLLYELLVDNIEKVIEQKNELLCLRFLAIFHIIFDVSYLNISYSNKDIVDYNQWITNYIRKIFTLGNIGISNTRFISIILINNSRNSHYLLNLCPINKLLEDLIFTLNSTSSETWEYKYSSIACIFNFIKNKEQWANRLSLSTDNETKIMGSLYLTIINNKTTPKEKMSAFQNFCNILPEYNSNLSGFLNIPFNGKYEGIYKSDPSCVHRFHFTGDRKTAVFGNLIIGRYISHGSEKTNVLACYNYKTRDLVILKMQFMIIIILIGILLLIK